MKNLKSIIGDRLKTIRIKVFNEGIKLSASQFAGLLNSTEDKIRNYELGRSNVPVELLVKLYRKGVNPTYILTGNGAVFADNPAGRSLRERIAASEVLKKDEEALPFFPPRSFDPSALSEDEQLSLLRVVAGDILKKRGKS